MPDDLGLNPSLAEIAKTVSTAPVFPDHCLSYDASLPLQLGSATVTGFCQDMATLHSKSSQNIALHRTKSVFLWN